MKAMPNDAKTMQTTLPNPGNAATFDPLARPSSEALSGHPVGKAKIGQGTSRNRNTQKKNFGCFGMLWDLLFFCNLTLIVSSQIRRDKRQHRIFESLQRDWLEGIYNHMKPHEIA